MVLAFPSHWLRSKNKEGRSTKPIDPATVGQYQEFVPWLRDMLSQGIFYAQPKPNCTEETSQASASEETGDRRGQKASGDVLRGLLEASAQPGDRTGLLEASGKASEDFLRS